MIFSDVCHFGGGLEDDGFFGGSKFLRFDLFSHS